MENTNVPIEMWNINQRQQMTNTAVEVWNSKLNSIIGQQQPNVFAAGTDIEIRSRFGTLETEIKGTWSTWPKTKKDLSKSRQLKKYGIIR
jgi:hypothetical protein